MADVSILTDSLIQDSFTRSIKDVFSTMMRHEVQFVERLQVVEAATADAKQQIVGNVGFVGNLCGLVYICFPEEFARSLACRMLGMDLSELAMTGAEALNDVMGEITNMSVGGFKNALADVGFPCKLTTPTIVRARGLSVSSSKGASRYVYVFECSGQRFVVDIQMRKD